MKAPKFWYDYPNTPSPLRNLLGPFAKIYGSFAHKDMRKSDPASVGVPVICVGNITVGGNGKTPCALAIMDILKRERIALSPFFLTRGYGGSVEGPELVDESRNAALWGDEALLLSAHARTVVSANRYQGAILAHHHGADAIVMDDGLQHYSLSKTIALCVIDGRTGFGNGAVIPAGPLRQPLADGLALADAFVIVGDDLRNIRSMLPQKPIFHAVIEADKEKADTFTGGYVAFCGLGIPDKFRRTLDDSGIDIRDFQSFSDHHAYTPADMQKLARAAAVQNTRLITTEKDYVRLPDCPETALVDVLPVHMRFVEQDALIAFLKSKMQTP